MQAKPLDILRSALGRPTASFRPGQLEAIELLMERKRLLVVQRTGWGKSMVYFVATRMLRDRGAGFTLVVSPLLALMRNQLDAAGRIGIRAATINSTNVDDWRGVIEQLQATDVDLLLVSPERLANQEFRAKVLEPFAAQVGLLVVDEAHCISDWGHDFRPDYRRISAVVQALPGNVPVIATTATANDRVVGDVRGQLGERVEVVRGALVRESIRLQNITIPSQAGRMAWLARVIPSLPGSGIVYTLTQRDADRVAHWLTLKGIKAKAYHADVGDSTGTAREELERQLLKNEVKALVSTVALGMGFDKPDLGFVIHFQRPSSVVAYYQQVGRAGRAVEEAFGVLLHGEEDEEITEYFMRTAFPPQRHVTSLLDALGKAEDGLTVSELQAALNIRKGEVDKAISYLAVEAPSPLVKIKSKWHPTPAAGKYRLDMARIEGITATRRAEQEEMRRYMTHPGCLMEFLSKALDDPDARACGKCANCTGKAPVPTEIDRELAVEAAAFLRRTDQPIRPRKLWPAKALAAHGFGGRIGTDLSAGEGRALCLWRDAGWGEQVADGKQRTGRFADELVSACVELVGRWRPDPSPQWVTCIPSERHPNLVPDFALRLASELRLPFRTSIVKVRETAPQKEMQNSFHQARNLDGAFAVRDPLAGPCLLIDDVMDSGWTLTIAAALLRTAGCQAVHPLVLALRSLRSD